MIESFVFKYITFDVVCSTETVLITYSNALLLSFFISSTPLADLYSLSYFWISGVSFGTAFIVGLIASFALGNYN